MGFHDLPASIFLLIIKEYIANPNDLKSIDIAFSDNMLRNYYLSIYNNTYMSCFESTSSFVHTFSSLQWIIYRNIKLKDIIVSSLSHKTLYVINKLPSLTNITFEECHFFNDKCYLNHLDNQLETIVIRNSMISNNALKGLTKSCHHMSSITLDFENCDEHDQYISDTGIYELAKNCINLRRINTRCALHISEGCVQHIRKSHNIEVYNCF